MCRLLLIIILYGHLAYKVKVQALFKRWVPNTNFDNPQNWDAGRVPCANDIVKFPEDIPRVYIQQNVSMQEIVLPMNGELVLSSYMSLSFPSSVQANSNLACDGQEIVFNGTIIKSWYDPDNWCEVSDPEGSCTSESLPRLDTEHLPCETDQVIFPHGATYLVDIKSGVDIYVGKISVRGKHYTTGSFRSYISSRNGKKEFHQSGGRGATSVNIRGSLCSDRTGCPCGNDGGILEQKVCEIQVEKCPELLCMNPLLPQGHCCHICGCIMLMDYGAGFKYKAVQNIIRSSIPRTMKASVNVIISRLSTEQVQVVIQDIGTASQSQQLVSIIKKKLQPDSTGINRYRITSIMVQSSAVSPHAVTAGPRTAGHTMSKGSISSLAIAIIGLVFIVALAIYCLMERKKSSPTGRAFSAKIQWPFSRFGRRNREGSFELGPSVNFRDNVLFGPETLRGFDNPTFGNEPNVMNGHSAEGTTEQNAEENGATISTIDLTQPTFDTSVSTGFANPLYGQQTKVEDLSYVTDTTLRMNPVFSEECVEDDSQI